MTGTRVEIIVVQFGILDWEGCLERFDQRPGSDVYFDKKFPFRVMFYLAHGMYDMYFAPVEKRDSQIALCEQVFTAQGNNNYGDKVVFNQRSFSMGDIVVLSNETVWLCTNTWKCLNPGVV